MDGKIGVIPTDTIYGIVTSAFDEKLVEKIYKLRKRADDKPFIVLIGSTEDLKKFGVQLTDKQKEFLQNHWPNPLSVVLPVLDEKFAYLHRGKKSLAFRMPKDEELLELLKETGPLVSPSANIEGQKPSETIDEAKEYFGNFVDFYIDRGRIISTPSTLIELSDDGSVKILREGSYKVEV
ncbi:threonylcarbamoyl-AMP synthase [Candidatus Daviesbacteria bacterium RIFCSPHIGHO2_02_FULL_36_13]|uniref:L-threonylcarbamoyladenylate synthase n=1 Tax=Candidatus Daviesbacteria bacterium RIFCSPHIGHO2_02_FULL_36_13 TaxID=1797768 RepID=A0A1F5JUC8_9BACT|nr:MAG: threonylcarbamoyl-AMP synthase [Candidatus Daviesbacteria bacterium RIFCSPHIGHO2_02_FULL_36_13]